MWFVPVVSVEAAGKAVVAATTTATTTVLMTATTTATTTTTTSVSVEQRVRQYFIDTPVMVDIARCESKFRQFTDSGSVLRGGSTGGMVGVFQFYEQIHAAPARALGFDITTLEGNLGYARVVYERSGTTPWRSCVPAVQPAHDAHTQLRIELLTKLLGLLQQLLAMQLASEA